MIKSICTISCLLLSLRIAVASPSGNTSPPPQLANSKGPQRPISFSAPSQHPIIDNYLPLRDETFAFNDTINVYPLGPDHPIPVTYSLSSHLCVPLISSTPYVMNELSTKLRSKHRDGITFPTASNTSTPSLPVFLAANITEQLYRSKFVISLSLKLSPLNTTLTEVPTSDWRSIITLLEQSAEELDRAARKRNGAGVGSVLVLRAEIASVGVLAEWRFWSVIDGLAIICEM
ncbi:hypothetical protein VTL71DRAFT_11729 [Oculimacula yallundae]|uniref:Uncharacterized protein n=1 Tax=Oculimacula yallundae TaxID=86028 RepID=A0ABR4CQZ2_9HELO